MSAGNYRCDYVFFQPGKEHLAYSNASASFVQTLQAHTAAIHHSCNVLYFSVTLLTSLSHHLLHPCKLKSFLMHTLVQPVFKSTIHKARDYQSSQSMLLRLHEISQAFVLATNHAWQVTRQCCYNGQGSHLYFVPKYLCKLTVKHTCIPVCKIVLVQV